MDHSVELELWKAGKHKSGFKNLTKYLEAHPLVSDIPASIDGVAGLFLNMVLCRKLFMERRLHLE
jgi:hypothetical protein